MNDGSVPRPASFLRKLSVQTKLVAVFLIFFLCAVAPSAATWLFLHQQAPVEGSPTTEHSSRPVHETTVPFLRVRTSIRLKPAQRQLYERRMRGLMRDPSVTEPRDAAPGLSVDRRGARLNETSPTAQQGAASSGQLAKQLVQFWGAAVLVLVGIGGLLLYLVRRHVVLPLLQLKREAAAVADGSPMARVTVLDREDEIGALTRAVRKMRTHHQAEQNASATDSVVPLNQSMVQLDEERRVVASTSASVTYKGPDPSPGSDPEDGQAKWTVHPDQQKDLSTRTGLGPAPRNEASRGNDCEPEMSAGDGDEAQSGVRYDDFMAIVHPQDREELRDRQEQALEKGIPIDLEYRIVHPGGEERFMRERGTAEIGKDGAPARFSGQVLDVTEQKSKEQQISRLQEDYDSLLASIPEALLVIDAASSEIVEANEAAATLFEAPVEELLGQPQSVFYPPGAAEKFETIFEEAHRRTGSGPKTIRHFGDGSPLHVTTHTGEEVPVALTITPLERTDRTFFVAVFRDKTEEQKAALRRRKEALREREARFRGLTNSIPGVVYQFFARPDGTYGTHFVSEHAEPMLGIDPDPKNGFFEAFVERVPTTHRDELLASIDEAVEHETSWSFEIPYEHPAGERMWLLGTSTPERHDDEVIFNGVLLDITDRKAAEQASKEERDRFETLFESLPTPVVHCNLESNKTLITDVNAAFEEVFGLDADAVEGEDVNELLVPPEEEAEEEAAQIEHRALAQGTQQFEVKRQTTEGMRDFQLQASGRVSQSSSAELYAIYTDITERKEREERLQQRHQKIESLYATTSRLLIAEREEAVYHRVHEVLKDVFDYAVTATGFVDENAILFADTSVSDGCQVSLPESVPTTGNSVSARALRTEEAVVVDGENASAWGTDEGDLASMASIPIGKHGVVTVGQVEREHFNSFDLRLLAVLGTYAAVVLDRLEREQELRAAKERAEDASEFKSVMLANISHEIRTPLTAINGFSEVLGEELSPPQDDLAERVHQSGKRLMKTFESVLQLSKLEAGTRELDREREALDQIVTTTVNKWRSEANDQSITLETHLPDSPVHGYWDADILGRVAENLLENAIKFTPDAGEVEIRVFDEGNEAHFEVEDSGIGIGDHFRSDMFRAFKQESEGLNREYEGAGLGLAVTKQAIDRMGGHIEVESEKGKGSRFTVRLPKEPR